MNIAVIGCGGIGSFFIGQLDKLIGGDQLPNCKFTCYDDDVVETKNIVYQNFESEDVDEPKANALEFRYLNVHKFRVKRVTSKDLYGQDLILICADNNKIRRDMKESGLKFIDARSNGRTIGIYSSDTENYMDTMSESDESSSCQYPYAIANNEIEVGNVIVAMILAQELLNFVRTGKLPADFVHNF